MIDAALGRRWVDRFGFTRLVLRLEIESHAGEAELRALAARAEETCLVSASLDFPVETQIDVKGGAPLYAEA